MRRICQCVFVLTLVTGTLLGCGGGSSDSTPISEDEAAPPNILFIAVDDLNDWVEPLGGHPQAFSPNITDLASRGMLFTNAHAASPSCNPSRVAAITGLAPRRTGVLENANTPMRDFVGQDPDTVFQYFKKQGYYVAGLGKLLHEPDNPLEPWDEYGFDDNKPDPAAFPFHGLTELTDRRAVFDWGPGDGQRFEWGDQAVATDAEAFLRRVHTKPFFLAVGFTLPHLPWYVTQSVWDFSTVTPVLPPYLPDDRDDVPGRARLIDTEAHRIIVNGGRWAQGVRGYLSAVAFMDALLGQVLTALDRSDYAENTIVVLWSDHGIHLGEKDAWDKGTLWEESTRVPVVIYAPDVTQAGSVSREPVSLLDLYPTLVDLAGLPAKNSLDGESLARLLRDPSGSHRAERGAVTSYTFGDSLRTRDWRYIEYFTGDQELYDHQSDPDEWVNLADSPEHQEIKQQLADTLARELEF